MSFDNGGYLTDPEHESWIAEKPHVQTTQQIAERRALILLGEPGMGKTYVLERHRPLLTDDRVALPTVHLNLAGYSEARLIGVFDGAEFTSWRDGSGQLCLSLDGFDEAHRRIQNLPGLVIDYVERWPVGRLFLRIACRTAEWPGWATDRLRARIADTAVVELQPLRRRDIPSVLPPDVPADRFLDAVHAARVGPLAARPMTLRLLARIFREAGDLPRRPAELYEQGMRLLCDEQPGPHRDRVTVSPGERLAVARRLAAIAVFCGRPSLWLGPAVDCPDTATTPDDCRSSEEPVNGATMAVTPENVRVTAATGLFSGRGSDEVGWAHGTFADFLAAQWIAAHSFTAAQVRSLLMASDGRVYPQVKQVAAWLVSADPGSFGWLAETDPESFATNVDVPGDDLRRTVVAGLFDLAREDLLRREFAADYRGLCHADLAEQVAPYLAATAEPSVRRLAIDLAERCGLHDQVPALTALVYDHTLEHYERVRAAWAIEHLTRDQPSDVLRPLADDPARLGDDPDDELLGAALDTSSPHALTTAERLAHARVPKKRSLFGGYAMFLRRLAEDLTGADLEPALDWLAAHTAEVDRDHLGDLATAIIRLALDALDQPRARTVLVSYLRQRAREHQDLFPDRLRSRKDDDRPLPQASRRLLAAELLATGDRHIEYAIAETGARGLRLITADDDLTWIADQYVTADPALRPAYASLFGLIFNVGNAEHVRLALELPDDHPLTVDLLAAWRQPTRLDSPEAEAARDRWHLIHGDRENAEEDAAAPVDAWIARHLADIASGDFSGFPHLLRLLTVPPGSRYYREEFQPDLTKHPRWDHLDADTRNAIVVAARRYLDIGDPDPDQWLGTNVRLFAAEAGYLSLVLLLRLDPETLTDLPAEVWRRWAPILVAWPTAINAAEWDDKRAMLDLADPHAHVELTSALRALIRSEVDAGEDIHHDDELQYLWDDQLAADLLDLLPTAEGGARDRLAGLFAERHTYRVRGLLHTWLHDRAANPDRASLALRLLLAHDAEPSWAQIRQVLTDDPDFAAGVLLASAHALSYSPPDLAPGHLAELYIWLTTRFPPEQDPDIDEVHWVSPRETVARSRDALLDRLRGMGTSEAVEAVRMISANLPYPWLRRTFADATDVFRAASWTPLRISDLRRIAAERHTRLVRSADELIDLLIQGLADVQRRLQGDTPEAPWLWDTVARRPKAEDEVSDYVRNRLADVVGGRGVSINREVQVRRIRPSGIGERTDLKADAVADDPRAKPRILTVAGEVKGAWHPDVHTAMRDQLVDRYMRDLNTRHGLYLVVWFNPSDWAEDDDRRRRVVGTTKAGLQTELDRQATDLARDGVTVRAVILDASRSRPR